MKNKHKLIALICAAATAMLTMSVVPVFADGTKVVSLGNDLTKEQKQTMLRYFKVSKDRSVQRIKVTNQDEVDHLSSFVPREQIGTRTVSCAYIKPTTSGGIRVKTANLEYVTANMIASTLADLGISNCEVVAACPFKVSGTGALTGIIMAYETATGEEIDEEKKEIAAQEIIIINDLAQEIGTEDAEKIINQSKTEAVQNGITDKQEIETTINNIITENNINISNKQVQNITNLTQNIVNQDYGDEYVEVLNGIEEEPADDNADNAEANAELKDSITAQLDESILGDDIIVSATIEDDLFNEEPEVVDAPVFEEPVIEEEPESQNEELDTVTEEEPEIVDEPLFEEVDEEILNSTEPVLDGTDEDDGVVTPEDEDAEEAEPVPDVSRYGFNMIEIIDKAGENAAREFIKVEDYMIEHFPAEWTEEDMRTKEVKPEAKMSEVAQPVMEAYYNWFFDEFDEDGVLIEKNTLFDTFMNKVTQLLSEEKITEDDANGLHKIAPMEQAEGEDEQIDEEFLITEEQEDVLQETLVEE